MLADDLSGFGSVTADMLTLVHEDYPRAPSFVVSTRFYGQPEVQIPQHLVPARAHSARGILHGRFIGVGHANLYIYTHPDM